jgi:membrane protease YdiL (CAAX protease family)
MTNDRRLLDQLVEAARSPAQKLRAAIVTAEVASTQPAAALLDAAAAAARDEGLRADVQTVRKIHEDSAAAVDDSARSGLIQRHGWFGKLATAHGLAADDATRREVIEPAKRTMLVGVFAGLGLLGVAGVGLVLFVVGAVLLATGTIRFVGSRALPLRGHALLETFTIYFAAIGVSALWGFLDLPGDRAVGLPLLILGNIGALFWPRIRGMAWRDFREAVGLTAGRGVLIEMLMGLAGYLALLPVMAMGVVITVLLQRAGQTDASHPIVELLSGPPTVLIGVFLLAVLFAPLTEELFFRGAFYGHTRSWLAWPAAALLVGVIFAAVHPQGWAGIPVIAAIGFNMAVLRQWRGSLIAPMTAHAINNGVAMSIGLMLFR